jgi:hypothetical protein
MNLALYEDYWALLAAGRRQEARLSLNAFIQSFRTFEERERWTREFLKARTYGERIRHEIYAELIFPVLLAGSRREDAWSLYWLAGTSQNLYRASRLHEQVGFKHEVGFLKEAYAVDSNFSEVRKRLLKSLRSRFLYAIHEWPAGILWGRDSATLDQCDELMSMVTLARELDRECAHTASFDDFESALKQYQGRLISRSRNPF